MEKYWQREVILKSKFSVEPLIRFMFFMMGAVNICGDLSGILIKELGVSFRDYSSGEIAMRLRIDTVSDRPRSFGFLKIALKRCLSLNRMDIEVIDVNSIPRFVGEVEQIHNHPSFPVLIETIHIRIKRANISLLELCGCRYFHDGVIRFKTGCLRYRSAMHDISVSDGFVKINQARAVEIFYHYSGQGFKCELIGVGQ
jgi:hypothetical protein